MNQINDFTLKIKSLLPECPKLASVKPDDSLSRAVKIMTDNNYSQLPVIESERLKGVISWRTIGESFTDSKTPTPKLVTDCMNTCVEAIDANSSLFNEGVIEKIEDLDYIVVKDSNDKIKGIVTASDLANRFERFSRAFAYSGEIDLRLRKFIESKDIKIGDSDWVPGFSDYIKALKRNRDVLKHHIDDLDSLISEIEKVKEIRHRIMHFKNGKLDEATKIDIDRLETTLEKIRPLVQMEDSDASG